MCAGCRIYSHSVALSIPECARSAAHIYISLHWVFLNVRGVPRILTFYNTKHSWICAAPRTYSQSIAFSIPKYPEYARHPAHTHQFLGLVFSRYARHTAHTHQFLGLVFSRYARHTAHTHQFLGLVSPKCVRHTAHIYTGFYERSHGDTIEFRPENLRVRLDYLYEWTCQILVKSADQFLSN